MFRMRCKNTHIAFRREDCCGVRIERFYYTEEKKRWEESRQLVMRERERMTAKERAAEAALRCEELERIFAEAAEKDKTMPRALNPEKLAAFHRYASDALHFAESCGLDISVEVTQFAHGMIRMKSDYLLLNGFCQNRARRTLCGLVSNADECSIGVGDGKFLLQFWFELAG